MGSGRRDEIGFDSIKSHIHTAVERAISHGPGHVLGLDLFGAAASSHFFVGWAHARRVGRSTHRTQAYVCWRLHPPYPGLPSPLWDDASRAIGEQLSPALPYGRFSRFGRSRPEFAFCHRLEHRPPSAGPR
jgi:hypothetical protein